MDPIILVLGIAGFLAALRGLTRASLRLVVRGVEVVMARETTDIRARRGDLTGFQAADQHAVQARNQRRRSVLAVAGWATLLAVPPMTPWTGLLYAAWAPLWLLSPRRR